MRVLIDIQPLQFEKELIKREELKKRISKLVNLLKKKSEILFMVNESDPFSAIESLDLFNKEYNLTLVKYPRWDGYFRIYEKYGDTNSFISPEIALELAYSKVKPDLIILISYPDVNAPSSIKKLYKNAQYVVFLNNENINNSYTKEFIDSFYEYKQQEIKKADFIIQEENEEILSTILSKVNNLKLSKKFKKSEKNEKKKLAYVSPLPPDETGIAFYSMTIIEELQKYYDIILVSNKKNIHQKFVKFPVISKEEFMENYSKFSRVIYHMGNSPYHEHMLHLLEEFPGVVVLHDIFLSDLYYWKGYDSFIKELYYSHGWTSVKEFSDYFKNNNLNHFMDKYPLNKNVLNNAKGVIIHSQYGLELIKSFYSNINESIVYIIPHFSFPYEIKIDSRRKESFYIASFGIIHKHKGIEKLLLAFHKSYLSKTNCKLIFVGKFVDKEYKEYISKLIKELNIDDKVEFTGYVSDEEWDKYMSETDLVVQLRSSTRGESSGALLRALSFGKPVIVNDFATFKEIPKDVVFKIKESIDIDELVNALELLYGDENLRKRLSENAITYVQTISPSIIAKRYHKAIEDIYKQDIEDKALIELKKDKYTDVRAKIRYIALNMKENFRQKQLLVDVTSIVKEDLQTGIQRVIKAELKELIENPPKGYRVEPVYLAYNEGSWGLKYARRFAAKFLEIKSINIDDECVEFNEGDIFYSPDLNHDDVILAGKEGLFDKLKLNKLKLVFMIYDLIPINYPQYTFDYVAENHYKWLKTILRIADKVICISDSVRKDVKDFIYREEINADNIEIDYLHLGADFKKGMHKGFSNIEEDILNKLNEKDFFLMVSTIEPRKGHKEVIEAFEVLWDRGFEYKLVLVGKKGWMVKDLIKKIENHKLFNRKLFWLGHVSDHILEVIYKRALATIIASKTEGFGLSIIESAYFGTPIIARDIPVFREVAGSGAYYFKDTENPEKIARDLLIWLNLFSEGKHPKPDNIKWMSWEEHVEKLKIKLLS